MNREKLVHDLQQQKEIVADEYDGSYEIEREIVSSYSKLEDYSQVTYLDLNAIYLMAIGTWKINVEKKKEKISLGCLPEEEKKRLYIVLDKVWDNACNGRYQHNEDPKKPTVGMFGSGFFSFEKMTTSECAQEFVRMLVDIWKLREKTDEEIFARAEKVLNAGIKGMKAASASVILHCLLPNVFPIINGNMGNASIFLALGIELEKPAELYTYIDNCRRIQKYRDDHLPFKNYRIMDVMAWKLDEYEADEFEPSIATYDPGVTKEQYLEILQDDSIIQKNVLDTVYLMYTIGGTASCKRLEEKFGGKATHYNADALALAKAVQVATGCKLYNSEYWTILFQGKAVKEDGQDRFLWKLRTELSGAISELDAMGFFDELMYKKNSTPFDHNTILYGPPGTGKTYSTARYAVQICDGDGAINLDDYNAVMERYRTLMNDEHRIAFVTFHQSYGYEEFIEGIKPVMASNCNTGASEDLKYEVVDGVFKVFCQNAANGKEDDPYVFVIDEINRGNISKILGELITLIEDTKRAGMKESIPVILPYSGDAFMVPKNVYILGTMNTADRSIALMDTALRRRFSFVEMLPKPELLDNVVVKDKGISVNIGEMLRTINKRIEHLYDREHTIGHAPFMKLIENPNIETLANIFAKSVIPLLQEYFYEDYAKIRLVLGDNAKANPEDQFIVEKPFDWDNVFLGNQPDDVDILGQTYEIRYENFKNIKCYQGIIYKV